MEKRRRVREMEGKIEEINRVGEEKRRKGRRMVTDRMMEVPVRDGEVPNEWVERMERIK